MKPVLCIAGNSASAPVQAFSAHFHLRNPRHCLQKQKYVITGTHINSTLIAQICQTILLLSYMNQLTSPSISRSEARMPEWINPALHVPIYVPLSVRDRARVFALAATHAHNRRIKRGGTSRARQVRFYQVIRRTDRRPGSIILYHMRKTPARPSNARAIATGRAFYAPDLRSPSPVKPNPSPYILNRIIFLRSCGAGFARSLREGTCRTPCIMIR